MPMFFETLVPSGGGGGGSSAYTEVDNYAALPAAGSNSGTIIVVRNSTGIWPLRRAAGLWRSNGSSWVWLGNAVWVADEITFTPSGGVGATTLQEAIQELDSEKATPADVSSAVTVHLLALDPHPQYVQDGALPIGRISLFGLGMISS